MIKGNARWDDFEAEVFYCDKRQIEEVRTKIISQINNGHMVILGENRDVLLNPKFIKSIQFTRVADD